MTSTAELIARVAGGDQQAWGMLAECHLGTLRAVAMTVCGGGEGAEDAVQEALLRVRAGAAGFHPRGPDPEADARRWLKRLAANAAIDQLRLARRRRAQELADLPSPEPAEADPGPAAAVVRALGRLAPPARAAVELRYRDGLEGAALAAALGISRVAARVRLHRAMALLRRHLAAEGVVAGSALLAVLMPPAPAAEAVPEDAFAVPAPAPIAAVLGGFMLIAATLAILVARPWSPPAPQPAPAPPAAAQEEIPPVPAATPVKAFFARDIAWSSAPVWSADGRLVVFAKALEPGQQAGELRALDMATGSERTLGRVPYPNPIPAEEEKKTQRGRENYSSRHTMVMHPLAASAGAQIVWLECRDEGLWSWWPADGRLAMHYPATPLLQTHDFSKSFRPLRVPGEGPEGRIAFVDRWSDQIAIAQADGATVAWQRIEHRDGVFLDAVVWWQGHLLDLQREQPSRLLWPVPARVAVPAFAAGRGLDLPWWRLGAWDVARGGILSVEVQGGRYAPPSAPGATAAMVRLADEQGRVRWIRPLAFAPICDRLRAASAQERAKPEGTGPAQPRVDEEACVIAYRHPHAVLCFTLEVRYGFWGHVYGAFARYDAETDRLEPLGDGTWRWISSGVRDEAGVLPACSASPDARAVAFRDGTCLVVLR